MLSAKAVVNFTLLAIIVPRVIRKSMSTRTVQGSEIRLNYIGAEASILVSVIGVLCVAIAFKFWMLLGALIIYALGSALPVFTMSLVKSPLISLGHSDTQDFSIVMLTKTLGSLVGAPLMASLWIQAIKIGGLGLGLPYFVSAVRQYVLIGRLLFANLSPDDICSCSSSCCKFALLVRLEPFKSLVFGLMYVDFGDATTRLSRTLVRRNRLCCPSSFFSVLFQPEPCRRKHRMSWQALCEYQMAMLCVR